MTDSSPPSLGIRAILRAGVPDDRDEVATVEMHDTVGAALDVAVRRLRSAGGTGFRVAVDVGEVDLDLPAPSASAEIRTAALLSAAVSGQLLVSDTAAAMLGDPHEHGLPTSLSLVDLSRVDRSLAGLSLDDLGGHRLHGVAAPMRVFEVRGDGLASAGIRTIDTVAASIPVPPTPLVGRVDLLAHLTATVRDERLVTLTGSGGTGKTRLAVETALASTGRFDAVHWIELAPLGSERAIVDELAALVGAQHLDDAGRREALLGVLAQGARLLVLDSAEHIVDATARLVGDATERCPALHVLVTSREPLGLRVEVVRRVPPLALADDASASGVGTSSGVAGEAVDFMVDRLARSGFEVPLDHAALADVHRICVRLDGIPLALELAAARATTLPLADLAAGLDDRFRLLSVTRRGAQPHQRTLEASISWSHDLLSEDERSVLRGLAVFSGSFDPVAAVEVVGGDRRRAADALDRLVERSLVAPTADGRLRLLETVRAFAEDRLEESGETTSARDRHLAWVQSTAARIAPGFDGPDPAGASIDACRLLPDARAAISHAEQTGRADVLWGLLEHLAYSCFYDGHIDEALDWGARAAVIDDGSDPGAAAPGLVSWALLATSRGDHDEIVDAVERAQTVAEEANDQRSLGRALLLGAAHDSWHRPAEASTAIAAGVALCADSGDLVWSAWGGCGDALALTFLGRPQQALEVLAEADAAASTLRSRRLSLDVAARRCICEYQVGRWGDARTTIEAGRLLAEGFTSISVTACFDAVEAWLAIEAGDTDGAVTAMDRAIDLYLRSGELQFIPLFVDARARASIASGSPGEGIDALVALRAHPGVEWASVYRHWLDHSLAVALFATGDVDEARSVAERLVVDADDIGNLLDAARGRVLLASLDEAAGETRRAESVLADALDTLWRLGAVPAVLEALDAWARGDEIGGRDERSRAVVAGVRDARAELLAGTTPDLTSLVELARRGRGDRSRPTVGWDSLTPTEQLVTELVAEGLTNPQIAERLIVGRATVKTHVSNVLRKLDLAGRTQLATAYRQRVSDGGWNAGQPK